MLPILTTPEYTTRIPSTKEEIRYRPFLVREEKILYMALEGKEKKEIFSAIVQILNSCILSKGIVVENLASFDIEFLFLQLRAKSVGEIIQLKVTHPDGECKHPTDIELNISDIEVLWGEEGDNTKIMLDDSLGVMMRYPKVDFIKEQPTASDMNNTFALIIKCIEFVFDKEEVYNDFTPEEMNTFLESMSKTQFEKILRFFSAMPKLKHTIEFNCSACKKTDSVVLEGLQSFFG